jgi:hypothetical protein
MSFVGRFIKPDAISAAPPATTNPWLSACWKNSWVAACCSLVS